MVETKPMEVLREESAKLLQDFEQRKLYLEEELSIINEQIGILKGVTKYEPPNGTGELSQRELEVMSLIIKGATNKVIANTLQVSETTVKAHMRSILSKLKCRNRAEAAAKYQRLVRGLTPLK